MTETNRTSRSPAGPPARRVRVTLRWIEILDSKDVDTWGEFRFRFRAGVPERDAIAECRIPEDERRHLSISEHPAKNRIDVEKVLFEGDVGPGESLIVEAEGEEIDRFTPNDPITPYRRVFSSPVEAAFGEHGPFDEATDEEGDPEQLGDWRFAYVVQAVGDGPRAHAPLDGPSGS